jgi:hypothetical protein
MFNLLSSGRGRLARRLSTFALAASALFVSAGAASAQAICHPVNGHLVDQVVTGPTCASPIGLCTEGTFSGVLRGDFFAIATTLTPTADTPQTTVVFYTGDTTVHATVHATVRDRSGDLFIKGAGSLQTTDSGRFVELQTIVGGTGQLAGASGDLSIQGTFSTQDGAEAEYTGTICVP